MGNPSGKSEKDYLIKALTSKNLAYDFLVTVDLKETDKGEPFLFQGFDRDATLRQVCPPGLFMCIIRYHQSCGKEFFQNLPS
jgi:hypothetical protein